jgi:hypothetical protein
MSTWLYLVIPCFLRIYAKKLLASSTYCVHTLFPALTTAHQSFRGVVISFKNYLYFLDKAYCRKPNTQFFATFYHAILSKLSKVNYLRFENGHLQAPGYKFWTTFTKLLSLTPSPPSGPPTWHAAALW